jgi:hypothetical protein
MFSLLSSRNDHSIIKQLRMPMPYPLEDREWVGITLWEQMENGDYFICETTTTHPEFPPAHGVVQIDVTRSFTVRQVGPRLCSVELVGHMDMGGAIPSWVNIRITIPVMKNTPLSTQQYVREGLPPLLRTPANRARAGTSRSSAPPTTSTKETGWSSGASSTTTSARSRTTLTS